MEPALFIMLEHHLKGTELKRQKKIVIDNNRTFLVENLDPEDVIDELSQFHLVGGASCCTATSQI